VVQELSAQQLCYLTAQPLTTSLDAAAPIRTATEAVSIETITTNGHKLNNHLETTFSPKPLQVPFKVLSTTTTNTTTINPNTTNNNNNNDNNHTSTALTTRSPIKRSKVKSKKKRLFSRLQQLLREKSAIRPGATPAAAATTSKLKSILKPPAPVNGVQTNVSKWTTKTKKKEKESLKQLSTLKLDDDGDDAHHKVDDECTVKNLKPTTTGYNQGFLHLYDVPATNGNTFPSSYSSSSS